MKDNLEDNLNNSERHWSEWIPFYGAYKIVNRMPESYGALSEDERREMGIKALYHGLAAPLSGAGVVFVVYLVKRLLDN